MAINIKDFLEPLTSGFRLSKEDCSIIFGYILDGVFDTAEIAGILVAFRMQGESSTEIAAGATELRRRAKIGRAHV